MQLDRRDAARRALGTALLAPRAARAATVTDGAGRAVPVPGEGRRACFRPARRPRSCSTRWRPICCSAGRAPTGRRSANSCCRTSAARPEVGRITGRGNTANLEVVLALKPDLILDIGIVNATYVSLADRVQQQTGIPYALLDGRFDAHRRRPIARSAH